MNSHIDDMNYYNDSRTKDAPEVPDHLPTMWIICPVCNGNCKVVNPSIDAGGLTAEDFYDDPDFAEDYQSGVYDIACKYCKGSGKIKVLDRDACNPGDLEEYDLDRQCEDEYEAERMAELRMGA